MQQVARVPHGVAKRRVGLGSALAPVTSLLGEGLPGRFPLLTDAIAAGQLGVESARVILEAVLTVQQRVTSTDQQRMVEALTATAGARDTEFLRESARVWVDYLDPDGVEPRARPNTGNVLCVSGARWRMGRRR